MRFFALSSTVLTIPSFNSNVDSINGFDPHAPTSLAWNATGVDQYLSNLSLSFTDYVSSLSQSSNEPCRHEHNLTDSLVLAAANNYVRYSDALLAEVRLEEARSAEAWEKPSDPHSYLLHKRVKRAASEKELDEVIEVAGHASQSEKPAWQLWKPEPDVPVAKKLIPGALDLPPPPNVLVRFTRYIKELTHITRERGAFLLRKFGLKERAYPIPVHSKTRFPSILPGNVDPSMEEKVKLEKTLLQQYNTLHRISGLHEPVDLDKIHAEMSQAMSRWNKIDDEQYKAMKVQLKSDAKTIIDSFRGKVQAKNAQISDLINQAQGASGPSKSKSIVNKFMKSKTKSDKQDKKLGPLEQKFDEAMSINVIPEVVSEDPALPNIKVDSSSVHPATEAMTKVGLKNKIPEIPPPRISFASVDLLRTHSANLAYEMNLLQKGWSELYDRLSEREELKELAEARLEMIEEMSTAWRELYQKYSRALKQENIQAVIDEQARVSRQLQRQRLTDAKADKKRLAKLRIDHHNKKYQKTQLEAQEAKILAKSKKPQIDKLKSELETFEAEMAKLESNIDSAKAPLGKGTSQADVASSSASKLRKRQFQGAQERITLSTQMGTAPKASPLEILISTYVKVAFSSPINSPGGMHSALRGGLFVADDHVNSVEEDAKILGQLLEVSQSLRSVGACVMMGDVPRISKKGAFIGCAEKASWKRATESKSFRSTSSVLLKTASRCHKSNTIPTESWEVFAPCEVLPPMC